MSMTSKPIVAIIYSIKVYHSDKGLSILIAVATLRSLEMALGKEEYILIEE